MGIGAKGTLELDIETKPMRVNAVLGLEMTEIDVNNYSKLICKCANHT